MFDSSLRAAALAAQRATQKNPAIKIRVLVLAHEVFVVGTCTGEKPGDGFAKRVPWADIDTSNEDILTPVVELITKKLIKRGKEIGKNRSQ